jgi:sodium-coupled neutral amino acid transporter 11
MGCIALMAHFSAPAFLASLQPKKADGTPVQDDPRSLRWYNLMTIISYAVVAVVDAICLTFGFLTFGGKSAGIVLNNYASTDWGAAASRFLTALSVGGSFPLVFDAARSTVAGLLGIPSRQRKLTGLLLASITAMALVVKNAGFVVSFNGILMGTAILYIFPSLMFLRLTQGQGKSGERLFCRFLVGFGVVSALIGAATTVLNTYFPHLLI